MKVEFANDLTEFKILSFLSGEDLKKFEKFLFKRTYKKNQILFTDGDPRERLYFLSKGYVKLEKTNMEATMLYVDYVKPHSLFPYGGMFTDLFYHHSAYGLTDIEVYYIPAKVFETYVKTNRDQLLVIINQLSRILELNERRLQTLATSNVKDRVEQSIHYLVKEFGVLEGEDVIIDLPMTITEIAKLAGTCRETASSIFRELKNEGLLSFESRKIIVHNKNYFMQKIM